MALPHPKPRNSNNWKSDEPNNRRIIGQVLERAVNIPYDRYGKDEMCPAKNDSLSRGADHSCSPSKILLLLQLAYYFLQSVMGPVYALSKGKFKHLVPESNRFIYHMHIESA